MRLKKRGKVASDAFPYPFQRFTVSGMWVGGICFDCECRVVEIHGAEGMTFAWCGCSFPDDHHEMEIL